MLINIGGSRPEWCISSMIYSRDVRFWSEALDIRLMVFFYETQFIAGLCGWDYNVCIDTIFALYRFIKNILTHLYCLVGCSSMIGHMLFWVSYMHLFYILYLNLFSAVEFV